MGLLDKLWDDTMGGPQPLKGVAMLRKLDIDLMSPRSSLDMGDSPKTDSPISQSPVEESLLQRRMSADLKGEGRRISKNIMIARKGMERATSLPSSVTGGPLTPSAHSPSPRKDENVWRSVFHPGSNKIGMDRVHAGGSGKWDNVEAKSPSVYDWMYDPKTKSEYR